MEKLVKPGDSGSPESSVPQEGREVETSDTVFEILERKVALARRFVNETIVPLEYVQGMVRLAERCDTLIAQRVVVLGVEGSGTMQPGADSPFPQMGFVKDDILNSLVQTQNDCLDRAERVKITLLKR